MNWLEGAYDSKILSLELEIMCDVGTIIQVVTVYKEFTPKV